MSTARVGAICGACKHTHARYAKNAINIPCITETAYMHQRLPTCMHAQTYGEALQLDGRLLPASTSCKKGACGKETVIYGPGEWPQLVNYVQQIGKFMQTYYSNFTVSDTYHLHTLILHCRKISRFPIFAVQSNHKLLYTSTISWFTVFQNDVHWQ